MDSETFGVSDYINCCSYMDGLSKLSVCQAFQSALNEQLDV